MFSFLLHVQSFFLFLFLCLVSVLLFILFLFSFWFRVGIGSSPKRITRFKTNSNTTGKQQTYDICYDTTVGVKADGNEALTVIGVQNLV